MLAEGGNSPRRDAEDLPRMPFDSAGMQAKPQRAPVDVALLRQPCDRPCSTHHFTDHRLLIRPSRHAIPITVRTGTTFTFCVPAPWDLTGWGSRADMAPRTASLRIIELDGRKKFALAGLS
jgi:hypothetical protein